MSGLSVELPPELIEAIAQRAAEIVGAGDSPEPAGYLDVAGAAEFLCCPKSRVYKLVSSHRIPHYKDGSRTLFDPAELRDYVKSGGSKCP